MLEYAVQPKNNTFLDKGSHSSLGKWEPRGILEDNARLTLKGWCMEEVVGGESLQQGRLELKVPVGCLWEVQLWSFTVVGVWMEGLEPFAGQAK